MATSAPFGTDLQPAHTAKIVGGKLMYVAPETKRQLIQATDSSHGGKLPSKTTGVASSECDNTITMVQQAFASILNKKRCLEDIYHGCYRMDNRRTGEIEIPALLQVHCERAVRQIIIHLTTCSTVLFLF